MLNNPQFWLLIKNHESAVAYKNRSSLLDQNPMPSPSTQWRLLGGLLEGMF